MDKQASQRHTKRTWHLSERVRRHPWHLMMRERMYLPMQNEGPVRPSLQRTGRMPIVRPREMSLVEYIAEVPRIRKLLSRLQRKM